MSPLTLALGTVHPISRVVSEDLAEEHGLDLAIDRLDPIHDAFSPMVREQRYDISELAIVSGIQAVAFGKPVQLLPVTLAARFQHRCIVCNRMRGSFGPEGLAGKRVGVRAYTQTTGAWVRAILQNEYGVHPLSIQWVTQTDAHVADFEDPAEVIRVGKDRSLLEMLETGEIDAAIFGNDLPDLPWLTSVIANPNEAAADAFARSGVVPINHVLSVSRAALDHEPDLTGRLVALFRAAKRRMPVSVEPDLFPIGLQEMRPSLEALVSTVLDQGLVPRELSVDELFPATSDGTFDAA